VILGGNGNRNCLVPAVRLFDFSTGYLQFVVGLRRKEQMEMSSKVRQKRKEVGKLKEQLKELSV